MAATDDLAFWEALAARGARGQAALDAYARQRGASRRVVARYHNGDGFVLERALATGLHADLRTRANEDWNRYRDLLTRKWLAVFRDCDVTPRLPAAFCYLWEDDDALDMRSLLDAKLVAVQAWTRSDARTIDALRENAAIVETACRDFARLARTPPIPGSDSALAERWEAREEPSFELTKKAARAYVEGGGPRIYFDNAVLRTMVSNFTNTAFDDLFWNPFNSDVVTERLSLPFRLESIARWPPPRPKPTVCLWAESARRLELYNRDDDVAGCLPEHLLDRLLDAGRAAVKTPKAWWSRARFDREVRACKATKSERMPLHKVWSKIDLARREGMKPELLERLLVALRGWARAALADIPAPRRSPECTPEALGTWLARAAYDALPSRDRLTDIAGWVTRDDVQRALERCEASEDERVRVRLLWLDLDSIVRSGAALDTKETAIRDAMHAYRYDRPPWSMAQRRKARALSDESLREL